MYIFGVVSTKGDGAKYIASANRPSDIGDLVKIETKDGPVIASVVQEEFLGNELVKILKFACTDIYPCRGQWRLQSWEADDAGSGAS